LFGFGKKKSANNTEVRTSTTASIFNWLFGNNTNKSYLNISTVYACIRMLSDSISMTPLKLYQTTDKGREEITNTPLSRLLKNPQANTTGFQWMNTMLVQLTGWGNAYSVIEYDDDMNPMSLIYIPSSSVGVYETFNEVEPYYYQVTMNSGKLMKIFPEQMLHFRNISLNGYEGLSPIAYHASTFDRAYYESEYATNFMQKGGSMSGIITTDKKLKADQIKQLKEDFSNAYGGSENAGKTPVLGDGMIYTQLKPMSPADADYVNSKKLTKSEIMEIYKVPPPLLGIIDATYSNTEQLALIYQRYTLTPIYAMIEQEMSLKLISFVKQDKFYLEFMSDALLNATAKDKAEVVTKLTEKGVMTLNEARRKYNLKDLTDLDEVVLPLNSAPMKLHKEVLTPKEPDPISSEVVEIESDDELRQLVHKLSSDIGRLKKEVGNGMASNPPSTPTKKV